MKLTRDKYLRRVNTGRTQHTIVMRLTVGGLLSVVVTVNDDGLMTATAETPFTYNTTRDEVTFVFKPVAKTEWTFQMTEPVTGLMASGSSSILLRGTSPWVSTTELHCDSCGLARIAVEAPGDRPLVIAKVNCNGSGSSETTFKNVHAQLGYVTTSGLASNTGLFITSDGMCTSSGSSTIRVCTPTGGVSGRLSRHTSGLGDISVSA